MAMNNEISNQIAKLFSIYDNDLFTTLLMNLYDEYKNVKDIPDLEFEPMEGGDVLEFVDTKHLTITSKELRIACLETKSGYMFKDAELYE